MIEICQGLKDENKVTSFQMSALACMQCSTYEFPWGVNHTCEVQFVCNYTSKANLHTYLPVMIMTFPCSMQGICELVHK